jgi:hypothetical protein
VTTACLCAGRGCVAGDKDHPANFGRLRTKGATSADMLAAPGPQEANSRWP